MSTEYGKRITGALKAVAQLHSDTSKLLVDWDSRMLGSGWMSVFDNVATRNLTYHVKADFWMAEGVFRYYFNEAFPKAVKNVTVCFLARQIAEPILLTANIHYRVESGTHIKQVCKGWDTWQMYFDWTKGAELEKVIECSELDNGRIESAAVLGVPLYSINKIEDVEAKMLQVEKAS